MNIRYMISILMIGLLATICGCKEGGGVAVAGSGSSGVSGVDTPSCPNGFVIVPAQASYTASYFCVAKYEAKDDGSGDAISQAVGAPWVEIVRPKAISQC